MRQVIFKKIKIQNFLSIGNPGIEFNFNSGITLITGENRDKGGRNGVGKSSLIESIYWCLFGNTIRELKREKIIHHHSGSESCSVELYLEVCTNNTSKHYIISRSIDPNNVNVLCDGVDITRSSMPKTDELIREIISASEEVFQNAVVMSANNTTPFMAQKKVDKRKFVEGVLNLNIFSNMLLSVRSDLNETKKNNEILSNSFLEKQQTLNLYQNHFDKQEEVKKQKLESLRDKIKNNEEKIQLISNLETTVIEDNINKLEDNISSFKRKIAELKKLQKECFNEKDVLSKNEIEIDFLIKDLKIKLQESLDKTKECPTCKRPYLEHDLTNIKDHAQFLKDSIKEKEKEKLQIRKTLTKHSQGCEDIVSAIEKLESNIQNHTKQIHDLKITSEKINHLISLNKDLRQETDDLLASKNTYLELVEKQKEIILEQEKELSALLQKIEILEAARFVVSEEGVKTFIIKKMLTILNSKLNFYLQALEAPCKCEFNEVFEETLFNDHGKECSYFNFSGGERRRIDLAILFMFQDILRIQTGTSFSLSMYDELFDSAIDEKGIDKVLDILKGRVEKYQENIYIVSHNKNAIKSGINHLLLLEKHNGKTRLMDQLD